MIILTDKQREELIKQEKEVFAIRMNDRRLTGTNQEPNYGKNLIVGENHKTNPKIPEGCHTKARLQEGSVFVVPSGTEYKTQKDGSIRRLN